jgi:uncharacterized membrane protein YidH (DUF202 family)
VTITIPLHLWCLGAYLGVGLAWLALSVANFYRSTSGFDRPFWRLSRNSIPRTALLFAVVVVVWPVSIWESARG